MAGAGVLYRHDLLLCVCAAVTIAVSYEALAARKGEWLRAAAVFLAGVLLVVAPLVLVVWSAVPHDALRQAFIEFPKINAAARRYFTKDNRTIGWFEPEIGSSQVSVPGAGLPAAS